MKKAALLTFTMMALIILSFSKVNYADPGLVNIGNGTYYSALPYYTYFMDSRCNILYTAAEITAASGQAGDITGLAFYVASTVSFPMNGFNIRMQSTSATSLSGFTNAGWTVVYSGTYTVPGRGWQQINFSSPFNWNGTSNLLVEICFDNTSYSGSSFVRATRMTGKTWGQYGDEASGCNYTAGEPWANRPDIRLNMNVAPPGGTLQGVVTKCCNSIPLAGATVSCGGFTATSGAGGAYTITGIPPGTYTATCTFPPLYLPTSTQVTISTNQTTIKNYCLESPPILVAGAITNVSCNGEASGGISTIVTGGVPPYTYNWSNGSHTPHLTGMHAGTYSLCVSDANSCSSCEVFVVTEPTPLYISAGANQLIYYPYPLQACATLSWSGESGGTPPYSIHWENGQTTPSITVCPSITTDYTVIITDANNCVSSDDVKVCVIDVRCGNNLDKVQICHIPPGNSNDSRTLCIPPSAVPEHLAHGDLLGACGIDRTCSDNKSAVSILFDPSGDQYTTDLEAYPNPFSESAVISFTCLHEGHVTMKLFDYTGKEKAVLFEQQVKKEVRYDLEVNGDKLPGGLFICVLQHSDGTMKIKKLIHTE